MNGKENSVGVKKKIDKKRYTGWQMFHDTWFKLERIARQLKIKQTQYPGHDVEDPLAIVAFWHGKKWDRVYDDYQKGILTDAEFADHALMLMNEFADSHGLQHLRVE